MSGLITNILSLAILLHSYKEMKKMFLLIQVLGLPAVCSVCQLPAEFPNPDSPLEALDTVQRI